MKLKRTARGAFFARTEKRAPHFNRWMGCGKGKPRKKGTIQRGGWGGKVVFQLQELETVNRAIRKSPIAITMGWMKTSGMGLGGQGGGGKGVLGGTEKKPGKG